MKENFNKNIKDLCFEKWVSLLEEGKSLSDDIAKAPLYAAFSKLFIKSRFLPLLSKWISNASTENEQKIILGFRNAHSNNIFNDPEFRMVETFDSWIPDLKKVKNNIELLNFMFYFLSQSSFELPLTSNILKTMQEQLEEGYFRNSKYWVIKLIFNRPELLKQSWVQEAFLNPLNHLNLVVLAHANWPRNTTNSLGSNAISFVQPEAKALAKKASAFYIGQRTKRSKPDLNFILDNFSALSIGLPFERNEFEEDLIALIKKANASDYTKEEKASFYVLLEKKLMAGLADELIFYRNNSGHNIFDLKFIVFDHPEFVDRFFKLEISPNTALGVLKKNPEILKLPSATKWIDMMMNLYENKPNQRSQGTLKEIRKILENSNIDKSKLNEFTQMTEEGLTTLLLNSTNHDDFVVSFLAYTGMIRKNPKILIPVMRQTNTENLKYISTFFVENFSADLTIDDLNNSRYSVKSNKRKSSGKCTQSLLGG